MYINYLKENAMEMYCSSKNISNLEFLKQFIWTQKTKISKFVIPILNTVYIDKLTESLINIIAQIIPWE